MNRQVFADQNHVGHSISPRLTHLILGVLAATTILVLLQNLPSIDAISLHTGPVLVYALLTAFALFFAVWLSEHDFSAAHAIGMMAFLSQPQSAYAFMTWGIFLGGLLGTVALYSLPGHRRTGSQHEFFQDLLFITARVTLSFVAAGQIYIILDGPLPLQHTLWENNTGMGLTIAIYSFIYISLYYAIFMLETASKGIELMRLMRINLLLILTLLVLPIPFTLLSAELAGRFTAPSEVMAIIGMLVIIIGLHAFSRLDYRLRNQLGKVRALSVAARRMRVQLDMDTLFKMIYRQVADVTGMQNFTVALYDRSQQGLNLVLVIRNDREQTGSTQGMAYAYDNALLTMIYETGAPRLIEKDVARAVQQMGLPAPREPMTGFIGVPLLTGDQKIGVMAAHTDRPDRHFDSSDLDLMNILAASVSIAIENAQLYSEQEAHIIRLTDLNRITGLLSGTLSPDKVLETILSSAMLLTSAEAAAVYLKRGEDDSAELTLVRSDGVSAQFCEHPPIPLLVQQGLPQNKRPLTLMNLATDARAESVRSALIHEKFVSLLELPLTSGDDCLGVLALYYRHNHLHTEEQMVVLQMFATQAAQAINNARIYASTDQAFQRTMEQLLTLAMVGQTLSASADLSIIGDFVLNHAIEATHSDAGAVVLYNDQLQKFEIIASQGYSEKALQNPAVFLAEVSQEEAVGLWTGSSRLSVPIRHREREIGSITLESRTGSAYSTEDRHFIGQIANQTVIALENARLFLRISEARDRLQAILDAMDEAILLIDLRGQVALANPRIDLIGLEPSQLLEHNLSELLEDPDLNLVQRIGFENKRQVKHLVQDMQTNGHEGEHPAHLYVINDPGKQRYIQRLIIPVRDDQAQVVAALLVFYDKTREQELAQARDELTRMIVHDLRSPLTAVTTSLRMLQDLVTKDNVAYPLVESTTTASQRAVRKLLNRVDTLLDISKMESGRLAVDPDFSALQPLVENVRMQLAPLALELDITFDIRIGDEVPLLYIDPDKVERLIMNLADNALKYSPTSSAILIQAAALDDAPFVQLDIIDCGPGIPDKYKSVLFNAFVQVEERPKVRRGVGLGLAFCRMVAEAHGGRIWINDNPAGGSIFSVTLPVATAESKPVRKRSNR